LNHAAFRALALRVRAQVPAEHVVLMMTVMRIIRRQTTNTAITRINIVEAIKPILP